MGRKEYQLGKVDPREARRKWYMVVKYILQAVAGISIDESSLCSEGGNNLLDI